MEHCRTKKEPKQPIPTFVETLALLMKVSFAAGTRGARYAEPQPPYSLRIGMSNSISMSRSTMSRRNSSRSCAQPCPYGQSGRRLLHLVYLSVSGTLRSWRRAARCSLTVGGPISASTSPSHGGTSLTTAMRFPFSLTRSQGRMDKREWTCRNRGLLLTSFSFIKECKAANKQLCVWTVNKPDWMLEASHESKLPKSYPDPPPTGG
jgi:hypothetical protein